MVVNWLGLYRLPNVVIINHAESELQVDLLHLANAMDVYTRTYLGPTWGVGAHVRADQTCRPHDIQVYIFEHADQANALGYHDVLRDGRPYGKVFLQETLSLGKCISEPLSHEIAEALVNGGLDGTTFMPDGRLAAREIADPVQGQTLTVDELPCANCVLPAWFESWRLPGSSRFDLLGLVMAPFQLLPEGWMSVMDPATGVWSEVFGSQRAVAAFHQKPAGMSRPHILRKRHGSQKEELMPVAN